MLGRSAQGRHDLDSDGMPSTTQADAAPGSGRAWRLALRFAPVVLVALALVAVLASGVLKHLSLAQLRDSRFALKGLVHAHPAFSMLLYVVVYMGSVLLSLPTALIMTLSGGFLFGTWAGGLAATVGSTSGAVLVFLISRLTVGDALERRASPRVAAFERGVRDNAFSYILTLRLIPMTPFALVNVAAGLLSIRLRTFIIATWLGVLPGTLIYAGLGSDFGRLFDAGVLPSIHTLLTPEVALPLAGLGLLALLPILYHWVKARKTAGLAPS
jgi:uncharacterized membrane protein YdjX (TVP38/TMEM64 family)